MTRTGIQWMDAHKINPYQVLFWYTITKTKSILVLGHNIGIL